MKTNQLLVAALFILAGAGSALASTAPVDPSIILRDAVCGAGCQVITTSNFSFNVASNGGGVFDFDNEFGNIASLAFIFENPGGIDSSNIGSLVNCQVLSYFENCSKFVLGDGSIEILFSGTGGWSCSGDSDNDSDDSVYDPDGDNEGHNECNGIPKGTIFTLDLFDQVNGGDSTTGGWVRGSGVTGAANVPEPATLLLILTALPLIGLRRRH